MLQQQKLVKIICHLVVVDTRKFMLTLKFISLFLFFNFLQILINPIIIKLFRCPGSYFAVNEIKFFMHNAILKYNFCTPSGKIEERKRVGPVALPSSGEIIIEKRRG